MNWEMETRMPGIQANLMWYSLGYYYGRYSPGNIIYISCLSSLSISRSSLLLSYVFYEYLCNRATPEEIEIQSLPPSGIHPLLGQLLFACLSPSPNARPTFKTICGVLDILLVQFHLLRREYLQLADKSNIHTNAVNSTTTTHNNNDNNNNNNNNYKEEEKDEKTSLLREKYNLDEVLMDDILESFLVLEKGNNIIDEEINIFLSIEWIDLAISSCFSYPTIIHNNIP